MLCDHFEIEELGSYAVLRGRNEEIVTLLKCSSCGKFLTLDSELIPEESIIRKNSVTRENMRTETVQLNSDIYEKIQKLINEEGLGEDHSKVVNELLGIGLRYYHRILPKARH